MKSFYLYTVTLLMLLATTQLTAQNFGGMGATLMLDTAKDGSTLPYIKEVLANSPAEKSGVQNGWFIIKADGKACKNKPLEDVVNIIRGETGTTIKLLLADNVKGKKAKTYDIVRGTITVKPPPDPVTAFYEQCKQATTDIRKQGNTIVKTFTSDCGTFYFSFEAAAYNYHAKVFAMAQKTNTSFHPSATMFDNNNEDKSSVTMSAGDNKQYGDFIVSQLSGIIALKRNSVGVVKTATEGCKAMYIVVYK